jgi:hypothetical protein
MRPVAISLAFILLFAVALCPVEAPADEPGGQDPANEESAVTRESTRPSVELSTFRAEVRSDFELVLPTGAITQRIPLQFGSLGIDTTLGYAVNGNELNGEMVFSYALGRVLPELRFFQSVDFEDYVDPSFETGGVDVFAEEEFVSRRQGVEPRVSALVLAHTRLGTAFEITDTFDWSLSENRLVDEGVDLVPQVFLEYDNMRAVQPNRALEFSGTAARISLSERFRNRLDNPVLLELENRLVVQQLLGDNWSVEEHVTFDTIIDVWREALVNEYQLGGYDSIRGYAPNEIEAMRVAMLSTQLSRRVLRSLDTRFPVHARRSVELHQHRVFVLSDLAVIQSELDLHSRASFYGNIGLGLGTVVSSGRIHLDVSVAAAQPFDIGRLPVFYVRTTLFDLERRF